MNTTHNNQPDFRTRLIAVVIALAIGFVAGWINGHTNTASPGQDAAQINASSTSIEDESRAPAPQEQRSVDTSADESTDTTSDETAATTDATTTGTDDAGSSSVAPTRGPTVEEDGWYTTKDEVALYIHTYGYLPGNFISKTKARARGWVSSEGNLDEVCPGMSIGGSEFYNDEGQLPDKQGRRWTECDINYHGGYRGAERIVFSSDGLVFYTGDHYKTFEQLY